jgi:hypothetical protein
MRKRGSSSLALTVEPERSVRLGLGPKVEVTYRSYQLASSQSGLGIERPRISELIRPGGRGPAWKGVTRDATYCPR